MCVTCLRCVVCRVHGLVCVCVIVLCVCVIVLLIVCLGGDWFCCFGIVYVFSFVLCVVVLYGCCIDDVPPCALYCYMFLRLCAMFVFFTCITVCVTLMRMCHVLVWGALVSRFFVDGNVC